jgi:GT2 family glycosyltransferase
MTTFAVSGNGITEITASIVTYKTSPEDLTNILSTLSQNFIPDHIAIIDNSPDTSLRAFVEGFGVRYVFTGRNLGFGGGHNRALLMYRDVSTYHLVVNPDIICGPEVIPKLFAFTQDRRDIGLIMPRILYPDGSEQRLCKQIPSPFDLFARRFLGRLGTTPLFAKQLERYELRHLDLTVNRQVPCLSGCFMFLRMSALREVGFFDERFFMYMEDFDLCRRIGARYKTVFYPDTSVIHGYVKGSYHDFRLLKYHLQSGIKYFMKWGWFYDPERKRLNENTHPLLTDHPSSDYLLVHGSSSKMAPTG